MATSLRELIVSVSADTTKYQREMDRASRMGATYFRSVKEGGATASRSWDMQTAAARNHATALEASTQAITRYASIAAGAFGAAQMIGLADEWTNISARVRLATESTEEFETVQKRLKDIANTTYRSFAESADQFASTARMMRELGFATNDTLDSAEALGLALVSGGADAQRGATALDAWGKSIAQGKIGTEQFNSLLLQTPRVAQALADGLGKTTHELGEMARAGQLTAQVAVPALVSQMGKLRAEVEAMPTEFRDAVGRLRNEMLVFVGGLNEATGATGHMVAGLELVAEHIGAIATIGGAAAVGAIAGKMVQMGQAAAAAAVGMVQSRAAAIAEAVAIRDATLAGQLKAQADLRRAQAAMGAARGTAASALASRNYANALLVERQASLAAAQAQTAYARATSGAVMAKRAALGLLGGPAGLAVTVGMVAAGWLLFRDNTDDAAAALDNWSGSADEAVSKFRELNAEQRRGRIISLEDSIDDGLGGVGRQLNDLLTSVSNLGLQGAAWDEYSSGVERLREEFASGKISADEFTRGVSGLSDSVVRAVGGGEDLARMLDRTEGGLANTAREIDGNRERLGRFNEANQETASQAGVTTGAIRGQAEALDVLGAAAESAGKRIQSGLVSLPGQIERIGKSAAEVARIDVRDWLMGESLSQGITSQDDPRFKTLVEQGERYIALATEQDAKQKALAASTKALADARKEAAKVSDADEHLIRLNEGYADQVLSLERQIALHGEVGRSAAMAYDLANGSLSNLAQSQKDYLQGLSEWLDWLDDTAALEGVWAETAKEHGKYAEDAKKQLKGMEAYADQAARNMQSALGDNLYNILDGKFSGIADSFGDMLKRMAAELMASQIWQALGSALSGYGGEGGWGNFVRGVGGAMQGGTKGGRAGGGPVAPFSAYDVTEHGDPELLSFGGRQVLMMGSKGGMVTPLMNKAGGGAGGGGGPMQVVINNNGNNQVSAREEHQAQPDGSMLRRLIIDVVGDSLNGGTLGQMGKARFGWREAV